MHVVGQSLGVVHSRGQRTVHHVRLGLEYARHFHFDALRLLLVREVVGIRVIDVRIPRHVGRIIVHHVVGIPGERARALAHELGIVVRVRHVRLVGLVEVVARGVLEGVVDELTRRHVTELREHEVGHLAVRVEHQHELVALVLLGILARHEVVLRKDVLLVVGQLAERADALYHARITAVFLYLAQYATVDGAYARDGYRGVRDGIAVAVRRARFVVFVSGVDVVGEVGAVAVPQRAVILGRHVLHIVDVFLRYVVCDLRAAQLRERFHHVVDVYLIVLVP